MASLYVTTSDEHLQPALPIRCSSEEKELQNILYRSPAELLVGEQIEPDAPRRWLLIKREMPIPDPITGYGRWAIDFLYVDQDATLTFVECKRYEDNRSRREVIGQVIDYVANASRWWTKDALVDYARGQAAIDHVDLDGRFGQLGASDYTTIEELLAAAADKLRKNDVRIILFLEEAPPELKTIVEFMNQEMSTAEVLLVEARIFDVNGTRVYAPRLWGYTEAIRARRQAIAVATGARIKWDETSFFVDLDQRVANGADRDVIRTTYKALREHGFVCTFGTGATAASFNVRWPAICNLSLMTVRSDGILTGPFGGLSDPTLRPLQDRLVAVYRKAGLAVPDDYPKRWVNYGLADWAPRAEFLVMGFGALMQPAAEREAP